MMELILSPPTTTTFLCLPLSMNCAPVVRPYRNPLQAAPRSKPQAFLAPMASHTMLAVAGNTRSGVTVHTIIRSISSGPMPRFFSRPFTASMAITLRPWSFPCRMRRSLMPVRSVIQASLVSTMVSSTWLESTMSGTWPCTAVIAAVVLLM